MDRVSAQKVGLHRGAPARWLTCSGTWTPKASVTLAGRASIRSARGLSGRLPRSSTPGGGVGDSADRPPVTAALRSPPHPHLALEITLRRLPPFALFLISIPALWFQVLLNSAF